MVIAALPTESQRLPPLSPRILRTSKVTLHERERAAGDSLGRARVEHLLAQGAGEYLGSGVPYLHIFLNLFLKGTIAKQKSILFSPW